MCGACSRLGTYSLCTIDGKAPCSRPCPRGHHPDADGIIRWMGLRWFGVPYPIRLWGRTGMYTETTGLASKTDWRKLEGCGCLVVAKRLWRVIRRNFYG